MLALFFNINNAKADACVATSFTANPTTVQSGQAANLTWSFSGTCTSYNVWTGQASGPLGASQFLYSHISSDLTQGGSGTTGPLTATTTFYVVGFVINTNSSNVLSVTVNVQSPGSSNSSQPPSVVSSSINPNPHNVVYNNTVYLVQNGARFPYTSAGAFLSYAFNTWQGVTPATQDEINLPVAINGNNQISFIPPRNGSLVNDQGTIYLITNGQRAGFTSAQVFKSLGYSFANVFLGDTSFLTTLPPIDSSQIQHPDGTVVKSSGTIYLITNGTRLGFPSIDVLNSWGVRLKEVVNANSFDLSAPQAGVMQLRMSNQMNIG